MASPYSIYMFLYIYLAGFSSTGGIQRFNRNIIFALQKIVNQQHKPILVYSGYDKTSSFSQSQPNWFKGFNQKRLLFILSSLWSGLHARQVVLGHINLSIIGLILKIFRPDIKVTLITHGIEVWGNLSYLKRNALRKADCVLAVSQYTQNILVEKQGVLPHRISIFQNTLGYQFESESKPMANLALRNRLHLPADARIILTISRLAGYEKDKGYDKVIEIMPDLLRHLPNLHYVLGGSASDIEFARLQEKIKQLNLDSHIHMPGYITDGELSTYYSGADIFVMPSKKEGFGIVYIEAMANGTPVIAGNKDGSTDAVSAYQLGHLIDPDNKEELSKTILHILSSESDYSDAEKVKRDFSFEKFCLQVEALTK